MMLPLPALALVGCGDPDWSRADGGALLEIEGGGSLQNPAWSPDSEGLLLTLWRSGYNEGPADLGLVDVGGGVPRTLVSDGSDNVNLPGSSWVGDDIVFSSSREPHDEIFLIGSDDGPGDERPLTGRAEAMAYEPTLSPDGEWVVFESHPLDEEGQGRVTRVRVDGTGDYEALTPADQDCRQPNWSPAGDAILYQRLELGQWDLWAMSPDGAERWQVTSGEGDETDASFSPDGAFIVYSSEEGDLRYANLFVVPTAGGPSTRLTDWEGYDGAPAWSPDGARIAFETWPGDPDRSDGTRVGLVDAPSL